MRFTTLGRTGLVVSRLALGCMSYGDPKWRPWVLPEDEARPFFRRALEAGINLFDTADMYSLGVSEEITGRLLREMGRREELVIATKVHFPMAPRSEHGGALEEARRPGLRGEPAAPRHRRDRPLPDPPIRPRDAPRRDPRGPRPPGEAGQGPLPRRELGRGVAFPEGARDGRRPGPDPVRLDAGPLQPPLPGGGARDAPSLPSRKGSASSPGPRSRAASSPGRARPPPTARRRRGRPRTTTRGSSTTTLPTPT